MKTINILQINDVHGYIHKHPEYFYTHQGIEFKMAGGYARMRTIIKEAKKEHATLTLDGGDTFHGTKPVVESKGEILIPILNHLELDAMTGHWDFAYGPKHLISLTEKLNYPFLAANVYAKKDDKPVFEPSIIKQVGDMKVLVIGLGATIVDKTMPKHFSKGIYLTDGIDELPKIIQQHQHDVDLIVVNSHMGYPQDVYLANKIKGVDIWLSAHTHNRLEKPTLINDTILIQSGSHGSFMGKLTITLKDGQKTFKHKLIALTEDVKEDPSMQQLIDNLKIPYDLTVMGKTNTALMRNEVLHSTLDELLQKSIAEASKKDIVFSNGWRYGPTILKGNITKDDIYNMVPMNPKIITANLTGKEIRDMLEENIERTFSNDPLAQMGGFLKRVYGLKIYFKIENPYGSRIQSLFNKNGHIKDDEIYEVAYINHQGVPSKYGHHHQNTNMSAQKAIETYLNKQPFIANEKAYLAI